MILLRRVPEPDVSKLDVALERVGDLNSMRRRLLNCVDSRTGVNIVEYSLGSTFSLSKVRPKLLTLTSLEGSKHHSEESNEHVGGIFCKLDRI